MECPIEWNITPSKALSAGDGKILGTIEAFIYCKNTFQDNSKYIIEKRNKTMNTEDIVNAVKKGVDVAGVFASLESILKLIKENQLTIDDAITSCSELKERIANNTEKDEEVEEEKEYCIVRRLTPMEAGRLQGFPDGYTEIDGKDTADAPQYKGDGNSWATPCAFMINSRIEMELRRLGHKGTIKYGTVCSGIEAHSVSVKNLDWKGVFFSEIEPFPCRLLSTHYPTIPNLGDMTQIHYDAEKGCITNAHKEGEEYSLPSCFKEAPIQELPFKVGDLEVFSGGTPCFTAGHKIQTSNGSKNIEDIQVGDIVISHLGRECKVLRTGHKRATVIVVACEDGTIFNVTKNHPFLVNDGRGFIEAGKLALNDKLCKFTGYEYTAVSIKRIEDSNCEDTVYNIEVENDHTYLCNGFCVHNCQDVSIAGKRIGMAENSGSRSSLAFHYQRIIKESKPTFTLWENVCFGGDTLVTTEDGHKRIVDVKAGDMVRSLDGKNHRVVKVMVNENKDTIKITAMGAETLEVTSNHPFYARVDLHNKKNPNKREFTAPEWIPAGNLTLNHYIGYRVDEEGTKSIGMANAYAVGRWLADGSVAIRSSKTHNGKRGGQKARIFISTGYKKKASLAKELSRLPYRINEAKVQDYAVNFTFTSDAFFELIKDCGRGARNKRVPNYVFSLIPEEQKELLRGYLAGDGHEHRKGEMTYSSSSKELTLGIARLVRNVYHRGVSIKKTVGRGKIEICGRIVKAHDSWNGSFVPERIDNAGKTHLISFYEDGFVWCPVKKIEEGDTKTVYNLSVADTHTYEANDIVVHNCGAFSSNGGADFIWFVNKCAESGYAMAWRVLDAQYTMTEEFPRAVPQRRRRIWMVGYRENDWRVPARIVFELEKDLTANPPLRVPGIGFKELTEEGRKIREQGETPAEFDEKESRQLGFALERNDCKQPHLRVSKLIDFSEMPDESDFSKVSLSEIYAFAKKVGEPGYVGSVFRTDKKKKKTVEVSFDLFSTMNGEVPKEEEKEKPEDEEWTGVEKITPAILENIGNAGILSNGRICTLKCKEWTSGIALSPTTFEQWKKCIEEGEIEKANQLLPEAYDETLCGLRDILVDNPNEKYNLRWRACYGILRRAKNKGKDLPPPLEYALIETLKEDAGLIKWYALNGKNTAKEGDLTEREIAKQCFDVYIGDSKRFEEVETIVPSKKTEEEEDEEEEVCGEEEIEMEDFGEEDR